MEREERDPQEAIEEIREDEGDVSSSEREFLEGEGVRIDEDEDSDRPLS
jgi:hypothetical protein